MWLELYYRSVGWMSKHSYLTLRLESRVCYRVGRIVHITLNYVLHCAGAVTALCNLMPDSEVMCATCVSLSINSWACFKRLNEPFSALFSGLSLAVQRFSQSLQEFQFECIGDAETDDEISIGKTQSKASNKH